MDLTAAPTARADAGARTGRAATPPVMSCPDMAGSLEDAYKNTRTAPGRVWSEGRKSSRLLASGLFFKLSPLRNWRWKGGGEIEEVRGWSRGSDGVTAAGAVMSCIIRRKSRSRAENPGGVHPGETGVQMIARAGRTPRAPSPGISRKKPTVNVYRKVPLPVWEPGDGRLGAGAP